jgi:hypothetical protein
MWVVDVVADFSSLCVVDAPLSSHLDLPIFPPPSTFVQMLHLLNRIEAGSRRNSDANVPALLYRRIEGFALLLLVVKTVVVDDA